jgi:hypothetical protein
MADTKTLIEHAYSAFNKRDIDGALALMTQDVSWPKASEGGKVIGKEEIRAYWTRQSGEFDPQVEPLTISEEDGGKTRVRVHRQEPSRGCSLGHRGSPRIHCEQRTHCSHGPQR